MARLFIEGIEADLGSAVVAITRQVFLLENLNDRNLAFTNTFELPNSQTNKKIFGNPANVASTSQGFDKLYRTTFENGGQIIYGWGVLKEANSTYKFQITDRAADFWAGLDGLITDYLDESLDDFIFNKTAVDNLGVLNDSIWLWPVISMHTARTAAKSPLNNTKPEEYSRPLVSLQKLAERAFVRAGWLYTPQSFEFPFLVSANHSDFFFTSFENDINEIRLALSSAPLQLQAGAFTKNVTFNPAGEIANIETGATIRLRGILFVAENQTAKISVIFDNGSETFNYFEGTHEIDLTCSNPDATTFYVRLQTSGAAELTVKVYTLYSETVKALNTNPWNGYRVKAFDNMPDFSLMDLARAVFQLRGLYFDTDSHTPAVKFIRPNDLDIRAAVDWSGKFIPGSEKVRADFGSYAKINHLHYTNDETVPAHLGCYDFSVLGAGRQAEGTAVQLPFGASFDIELSDIVCSYIPIYNNTERTTKEKNIRLFEYYYTPLEGGKLAAQFGTIGWAHVAENYYQKIFDALYRTRVVECEIMLRPADFSNYDFSRPVYISELQSHFLVLQIAEFVRNLPTKVLLLKL